jgi:hypothetical protein
MFQILSKHELKRKIILSSSPVVDCNVIYNYKRIAGSIATIFNEKIDSKVS